MNKSITLIVLSVLVIAKISCSYSNSSMQDDCKIKEIRTLFTIPGVYEGKTAGYSHYALIPDFSKKCMDSVTMVNLAIKYSDTVKVGNPADIIMFFNSDRDFVQNETSQVMEEINKSCLVVIGLDVKTKRPNDFIFYNQKGERLYWGNRWLPNGK
ncbi:hypothetical protein ACFOW1_00015 [Parasediminibacterium paludis]|uniref:Uncharacterized protein n=1 Tax=Parasediminibacterium paludis TaxID=908966 RepID=A0ABV8PRQ4_9BACT